MEDRFTEEIVKNIKTWVEYMNSGHYGNSRDIVNTYNIVFNGIKKPQNYTNCGSCLRRCVIEMNTAYEKFVKEQEEKLKALQVIDEFMSEDIEEELPKKKNKTRKNP